MLRNEVPRDVGVNSPTKLSAIGIARDDGCVPTLVGPAAAGILVAPFRLVRRSAGEHKHGA